MIPHRSTLCVNPLFLVVLALLILLLPGCFHSGSGGDGTSNANPTGYYTGTASVNTGAGGALAVNALQVMVDGNRIRMLDVDNMLVYDGTLSITDNAFTAEFTLYTDGGNPVMLSASGMITAGSSITGTLTGTGAGSGTFNLLYAATNDQAAAIASTWLGAGGGFDEFGFTIDAAMGSLVHKTTAGSGQLFDTCKMNGTITSVSNTRLYFVDVDLTDCNDLVVNGTYTGLTTTRDEDATDDRLVFIVSDGRYTLSGEFNID